MTILKDRPIWIFREHRSGSTWLAKTIAEILDREHIFFDTGDYTKLSGEGQIKYFMNRPVEPADNNRVFSTHTFKALESLDKYNNPLVIRCARRDVTEQFLSYWTCQATGFAFKHNHVDPMLNLGKKIFEKFQKERLVLNKQDLRKYLQLKQKYIYNWNEYASKHPTQTVFYEDLFDGVKIEGIDTPLKFDIQNDYMLKLPDYKQDVFVNYEQINEWVTSECDKLGLLNN
jgi:hypothetical protein